MVTLVLGKPSGTELTTLGLTFRKSNDKIPSAFIITGPNIDSQSLLFEQISETLQQSSQSKFIRLRSTETSTVKAALKKIIRDATSRSGGPDDEDLQVAAGPDVSSFGSIFAFARPKRVSWIG